VRDARVILIPILLVAGGVVLLIGCIPIPATHQLQPNGKPRPEWAVGTGADDPVRLGHTRIEDAFVELTRRTSGPQPTGGLFSMSASSTNYARGWTVFRWRVSPDGRLFSMQYSIRKATWVMPLCFTAAPEAAQRWINLQVNDDGVVTASHTTDQPATLHPTPVGRWLEVFDERQRRKLYEAGVFPSDEELRQAQLGQDQIRMRSRPSPPPTSR
jgi:hypothetical protein